MRIALFHNWSPLGTAVARALIGAGRDQLWLIGGPLAPGEQDASLEELAAGAGVPMVAPADAGAPGFVAEVAAFAPELLLVATFPRRLGDRLLETASRGAVNLHPSLLPAYRGAMPEFWALRNGDRETGVTAHWMTAELDGGRMLARVRVTIHDDDNLATLSIRLGAAAAQLALDVVGRLREGEFVDGREQDPAAVTRAPLPREADLTVRWSEPAASIERLVRAAYPVLAAHATLAGQPALLRRVRVVAWQGEPPAPGQLAVGADGVRCVGAGDGQVLALDEVTGPDGRPFAADRRTT